VEVNLTTIDPEAVTPDFDVLPWHPGDELDHAS